MDISIPWYTFFLRYINMMCELSLLEHLFIATSTPLVDNIQGIICLFK